MIKLEKGDEPDVLIQNRAAWEATLAGHRAAGTEPTDTQLNRYNHPDVKAALLSEVNEKCAYCESKFRHVEPGDIEHIVPKRLGDEWRFRWENLTIACSVCNTKKGVKQNLFDPYEEDPSQAFFAVGPALLPLPEHARAIVTESALDLNRQALLERRHERLRSLHRLLMLALAQDDPADRSVLLDELRIRETGDDVEYAAVCRAYVNELKSRGFL